jgi:hypothetical protein
MTADIVVRLQAFVDNKGGDYSLRLLVKEALDEIERLRGERHDDSNTSKQ